MRPTWNNKKYPPSVLLVWCIVPFLGSLMGIGLFIYGIFRFRSVLYSVIGLAGACLSIFIASLISYRMMQDEGIQATFQSLSKDILNELAVGLEEFKSRSGEYPDSLNQLLEIDKLFFMKDPVQSNQRRENSGYRYQRKGDKYILFSAGQDGVDGTFDDIYPDSIMSNKFFPANKN